MTSDLLPCPLTGTGCRHASLNYLITRVPKFKILHGQPTTIPDGEESRTVPNGAGVYCSDRGQYISEMRFCPIHTTAQPISHSTKISKITEQQEIEGWIS